MKIAFIRGPFLSPWELQTYLPLVDRQEFVAVGADWQVYPSPLPGIGDRVEKPHLWASASARIDRRLPVFINRLRSWTLGESFGLVNLESAVRNAEILHSAETHSTMTYQCLQIRRQRPCKVVATIWENLPHMGETHPRRKARKREALRELDGFLAVTETSRRMLLEDGAPVERIEVISMAVDLSHFKPGSKSPVWVNRWQLKPQEKVVLFIGRWVEEKGIRELLKTIPLVLSAAALPVRFCFVGSGPLEPVLQNAVRAYPGRVTLESFASYDQLPSLHNMADVFVLPSKPAPKWEEQFGYVLAESMACGKAVLTTRTGSIPDVVGDAATLVRPGDPNALASALIALLSSDEFRRQWGEKALTHALRSFDAERNAARIETFYRRILGTKS